MIILIKALDAETTLFLIASLEAEDVVLSLQPALERTRTPLYSAVFSCTHCLRLSSYSLGALKTLHKTAFPP